jgi:ribosome biogenesis protein MAK21
VALNESPPFICGSLFLVSEVLRSRPALWNMIQQAEEQEEHFVDTDKLTSSKVSDSEYESSEDEYDEPQQDDPKDLYASDSDAGSDLELDPELQLSSRKREQLAAKKRNAAMANIEQPAHAKSSTEYDPHKRDPKYANAQGSCFWELVCLSLSLTIEPICC